MAGTLHLLRPFTGWWFQFGVRAGQRVATVDDAEQWVTTIRARGHDRFYTTTARRPTRMLSIPRTQWGSVYFCRGGTTLFRMPIGELIEGDMDTDIVVRPEMHRCERKHVGMVRGWRYLNDEDAPPDMKTDDRALPDWYLEGA